MKPKPPAQSQSFDYSQFNPLDPSQLAENSTANAEKAIRRVTLRQLLGASQYNAGTAARFAINDARINMVMVVANICWHHEDSLKIGRTYELDDGTGRIRGRYLDPTYNLVYEPFAYVRVTGQLEDSRGSRMLKITNIQLIFDAHEIYYHILHSIFDTLVDERGPPPPGTFPSPFNEHDAPSRVEHFSTLKVSNHSTSEPSSSAMDPQILNLMESGSRSQRLPLLQLDALVCIQDPQMPSGEYGVFIGDIIERLKEKYSDLTGPEMWKAMELLIERGLVYSPVDLYYGKV